MKTELLYLNDTYLFVETAHFLEVREHEKGVAVILDRTIFYPQGGGQPSDTGYIQNDRGVFRVDFVGLDSDGVVWHIGEFERGGFEAGDTVDLEISHEKRVLHARIHSGGHLLDVATKELNLPLVATKGFHFPDGPYVEYTGEIEVSDSLKELIEKNVNELITRDIPILKEIIDEKEAHMRGLHAPSGKEVRVVHFEGDTGCGCGGTHVRSSGEIGQLTIRKVSSKNGTVRISYGV